MKTNAPTTKYREGFASIILIVLVIVLVLAAVIYFVVAGSKNNVSQSLSNLYAKPTQAVLMTPTPAELDNQLDAIPDDSDPSSDLNPVDSDINSL